jgi:hypothetical protein
MIQMILKMTRRRSKPRMARLKLAKREAEPHLTSQYKARHPNNKRKTESKPYPQRKPPFQAMIPMIQIPHPKMIRRRSNPLLRLLLKRKPLPRRFKTLTIVMKIPQMKSQRKRLPLPQQKAKLLKLKRRLLIQAMKIAMKVTSNS